MPGLRDVVLSVHCHDDLGLAVANSLAGVEAGCRQVECAVNGIGERAGNASLEEVVMLLRTREPSLGLWTGIDTTEIARTSRLVSRLTGYQVQPNKAIVGRNAFAHEAGIHQDGVLKERTTYEIMDATIVGLRSNSIVLGKHSGRHALRKALEEMGFELDGQTLNTAFKRFKEIADRKKQLTALDLEALVTDELRSEDIGGFALDWFEVESSSLRPPHAKVSVTLPDGGAGTGSFTGDGPIDAVFQAINVATGVAAKLSEFTIGAVTEGQDALGEVSVVLEVAGVAGAGQGVSTDIIDAAARAYVRALSVAVARSRADQAIGLPGASPGRTPIKPSTWTSSVRRTLAGARNAALFGELRSLPSRTRRLARLGTASLDESLDERKRLVGDLAPAAIDRERVAAVRDLDDLSDTRVPPLLLERGVCDRPGHRVVLLAGDDQQRPPLGVLAVNLRLGPRVQVGRRRLEQRCARRRHMEGLV